MTKLEKEATIITNIIVNKEAMQMLLDKINDHWGEEDKIYRFYHTSFKLYNLQEYTQEMFNLFLTIGESKNTSTINQLYMQIFNEGTYKKFDTNHNSRWSYEARPILEAFWHSKHILEMMLKYGNEERIGERRIDSGWATVLSFYNIR